MTSLREESPASRPTGADIGDFSLAYSRSLLCCCGFQACAYTARHRTRGCPVGWYIFLYSSSPQPFRHQGLVSWKTVFPWTRGGGGWFWDDSSTFGFVLLWESNATADMTGGRTQTVMQVMESRCKYRWSFACSLVPHLLLCSLVPNGLVLVCDPEIGGSWYRKLWNLGRRFSNSVIGSCSQCLSLRYRRR